MECWAECSNSIYEDKFLVTSLLLQLVSPRVHVNGSHIGIFFFFLAISWRDRPKQKVCQEHQNQTVKGMLKEIACCLVCRYGYGSTDGFKIDGRKRCFLESYYSFALRVHECWQRCHDVKVIQPGVSYKHEFGIIIVLNWVLSHAGARSTSINHILDPSLNLKLITFLISTC